MTEIDVLRIDSGERKNIKDIVTVEAPLTIYLNGKELLTLLCSPDSLKELSAGFLYSTGLIKSINDIKAIKIDNQNWTAHIELHTKNAAAAHTFKRIRNNFKISSEQVIKLMESFQKRSLTFRQTAGVHSAALSDSDNILLFKEDIGRLNALDKVIGEALMKNLAMQDLIVLSSGRISSEIMFKAQKTGSAFLISRNAPTDQAIKLAREWNLTLVGFVRGQRMNVYSGKERVKYG